MPPELANATPLLGMSVLSRFRFEIDTKNKKLKLWKLGADEPAFVGDPLGSKADNDQVKPLVRQDPNLLTAPAPPVPAKSAAPVAAPAELSQPRHAGDEQQHQDWLDARDPYELAPGPLRCLWMLNQKNSDQLMATTSGAYDRRAVTLNAAMPSSSSQAGAAPEPQARFDYAGIPPSQVPDYVEKLRAQVRRIKAARAAGEREADTPDAAAIGRMTPPAATSGSLMIWPPRTQPQAKE